MVSDALDGGEKRVAGGGEAKGTLAELAARDHFGFERVAFAEKQMLSDADLASGAD